MKACFKYGCCYACHMCDACASYVYDNPYLAVARSTGTVTLELCESRHEFPDTRGSVFPMVIADPTDIAWLDAMTADSLGRVIDLEAGDTLRLYVTGLTPALVSVINWCKEHHIKLVLLHYNKMTGGYFEQPA